MARGGFGFRWLRAPSQSVTREVQRMIRDFPRNVDEGIDEIADQTLAFARANHRWQNITGAAERALHTYRIADGFRLAHGVFYGIFLELKHAGRYGVLRDAITYASTLVPSAMGRAITRTLFG